MNNNPKFNNAGGNKKNKKRKRPQQHQSLVTQVEKSNKKPKHNEPRIAASQTTKPASTTTTTTAPEIQALVTQQSKAQTTAARTATTTAPKGKDVPNLESVSVTEADAKDLMDILRGDLTKDELANEFWNQQPFVSSNKLSRLPKLLGGVTLNFEHLRNLFRSNTMYWQQDVCAVQYSAEDDEVVELQERGEITWEQAMELCKEGWALSFPSLHYHSPALLRLYSLFSTFFGGNDDMRIELTLAPLGVHPSPPLANGRHLFLFQLEATQDIHIYKAPSSATAQRGITEQEAVIYGLSDLLDGQEDLHIDSLPVEKGDCVYIPGTQGFIYFRQPLDENGEIPEKEEERKTKKKDIEKDESKGKSLDLIITIPNQTNVTSFLELVSREATVSVLEGTKPTTVGKLPAIFSMTNTDTNEAADKAEMDSKTISKILQKSIEIQPRINEFLEFRRKFHKCDFVHALPKEFHLRRQLEQNNGLVMIENFLPEDLAFRIEEVLKGILESQWVPTESEQDYEHNNIAHTFLSSKQFAYCESVFDIFRRLNPEQLMTLSAARYTKGHFIDKHDDRAMKTVNGNVYDRDIALVYYLSRDFTEEDGGAFVDLNEGDDNPKPIVPKFNTLLSFTIPREHAVRAVTSDKTRYSLFGWFLKPFPAAEDAPMEEEEK